MKKSIAITSVISLALCAVCFSIAAGDPPVLQNRREVPLPSLMLAKLGSTQQMLTGLVSKDFGATQRAADNLQQICKATEWEPNADPVYVAYKEELGRQASKLSELAQQHNLEGAAFVYTQAIGSCVSCHTHCRDVLKIAELPNAANGVISIPVSDDPRLHSMPILRR